jgi:hypothetical protein
MYHRSRRLKWISEASQYRPNGSPSRCRATAEALLTSGRQVDARVVLADGATRTLAKSLDQFLRLGLALPSAAESDPSREDVDVLGLRTAHGINRDKFKFGVAEAGDDFRLGKIVNPTCRKARGGNP